MLKYLSLYWLIPQPWQWENEAVGQWVGSGEVTHYDLLWDLEPYLSDCRAPLGLLLVLLRLSYGLDLWGALEPTFALVLAWSCSHWT